MLGSFFNPPLISHCPLVPHRELRWRHTTPHSSLLASWPRIISRTIVKSLTRLQHLGLPQSHSMTRTTIRHQLLTLLAPVHCLPSSPHWHLPPRPRKDLVSVGAVLPSLPLLLQSPPSSLPPLAQRQRLFSASHSTHLLPVSVLARVQAVLPIHLSVALA